MPNASLMGPRDHCDGLGRWLRAMAWGDGLGASLVFDGWVICDSAYLPRVSPTFTLAAVSELRRAMG
jgi:hypothetical protein